jgi:hypothetical protein
MQLVRSVWFRCCVRYFATIISEMMERPITICFNLLAYYFIPPLRPEDGGSKILRNVDILPQNYTVS